jgi:hypothetical protein
MARQETTSFRLLDESGNVTMPIATDFLGYLFKREKHQTFRFGEWLASVSDSELATLVCLTEHPLHGDCDSASELLAIYLIAIAAERDEPRERISIDTETASTFEYRIGALAGLEDLRRRGMVEIPETMGLDNFESTKFRLTEIGICETKRGQRAQSKSNSVKH